MIRIIGNAYVERPILSLATTSALNNATKKAWVLAFARMSGGRGSLLRTFL
jgi:hypothetical protein